MFPSPKHRAVFLTTLRTLGVAKLVVTFSGGGDSGDIESVDAYNAGQTAAIPLTAQIPWSSDESCFDEEHKTWAEVTKEGLMSIEEIAKELTLKALEAQGLDWYNNDGGQGSLEIDFSNSPPTINLEVGINHMTTEDYTFDLNEE